jgi:acyl-CoA synthetase (AMP-forming)/AMP-acid ligase II
MHLAEIVRRQAAARPGDPSYSCAETDLTWRQTDERTSRLAAVAAFVVCQPGAAISEEAVIARCRAELAHFKVPGSVRFCTELPRNAMGKLDKRAIRAPYWPGSRGIAG